MSTGLRQALHMKHLRPMFALMIVASFATVASAQSAPQGDGQANLEALKTLKRDLVAATNAMKPCLPIYEGHRGKSESAVSEATKLVNAAIVAATPADPAKAAAEKPAAKNKNEKAAKEPAAVKPATKEQPAAAKVPTTETDEEKIAKSQAGMRKALEAIQQALKDLKAATSSIPEADMAKAQKLLEAASDEATKSIALHAGQG